jgi:K+-transporting ATPase ATPase A chain
MTINGWLQISLVLLVVLALCVPLGAYMARALSGQRNFLSPVLGPVERELFRIGGVDPSAEQGWLGYAAAMLAFNAAGFVLLYALLRLQGILPFNPQGFAAVPADLAFNTRQLRDQHELAVLWR